MPTETPIIYTLQDSGYVSVIYLDTDPPSFWSVIRRHTLNDLAVFYGGMGQYRTAGADWVRLPNTLEPIVRDDVPSLNERGIYVWRDAVMPAILSHVRKPFRTPGYWDGARIAWEMIAPTRLRVVLTSGDLMPNLLMAFEILTTIWRVFPESRNQLPDIDGLIESWAYDEPTREDWREFVRKRKEAITSGLAAYQQARGIRNDNAADSGSLSSESAATMKPLNDLEKQWLDRVKQGIHSGNIAQYCTDNNISRTTWYEWRAKFEQWGLV